MQSGKTFKAHILCIGKKTQWKNKVFPAYGESEVQEVNRDKVQVWRERNSLNSKVEVNVIDKKQKIVFIALKIEQDILRKKKIYYVENKYKLCEIHGLWDSPMDLETETEISILPNMEKQINRHSCGLLVIERGEGGGQPLPFISSKKNMFNKACIVHA